MIGGIIACLYLGALWYVAPLLAPNDRTVPTQLRNVAIVGIGLPLVLASLHALYAPVVWVVLAVFVVARMRRRIEATQADLGMCLTLAIAAVLVWPPLVRPVLDGDTLLYHLPIAASWAQAHSLWTTASPAWFYPPGSEALASGLLLTAGRWSLPLAGMIPLFMIVARLYAYARASGASSLAAGSVALAFVSTPIVALQTGSLENDVWLAAFVVEVLAGGGDWKTLGVTSLIKPVGWMWGLLNAVSARMRAQALLVGMMPLALWLVRDAILLRGAIVPPEPMPPYFATTIVGGIPQSLIDLASGIGAHTPQTIVWLVMIPLGLAFERSRPFALVGIAGLLLYVMLPLSYAYGGTNWALAGTSLRFAMPALACGGLVAATLASRAPRVATICCGLLVLLGMGTFLQIYSSDSASHWAWLIAVIAIVAALLASRTRDASVAAFIIMLVIAGGWYAEQRGPSILSEGLRDDNGTPTHLFAWLAQQAPDRMVAVNVRVGLLILASPTTEVIPATASTMCRLAIETRAPLVIASNEYGDSHIHAEERAQALRCGKAVFDDGSALVVAP